MPQWRNSNRRAELPSNWSALRIKVLDRDDHRCVWDERGVRCNAPATDVDHIRQGADHSLENLRSLCSSHHLSKSSYEGGRAKAIAMAKSRKKFRRSETHPGLL